MMTDALEALNVQVWTAGPDGLLRFVNRFTAAYFDRSQERLVGEGWQDVLHSADVPLAVERWTNSVRTGEPYEVDFRLLRGSDRKYRWHRASARLVQTPDGPLWVGSNVDVDAEHRAAEVLVAVREQMRNGSV